MNKTSTNVLFAILITIIIIGSVYFLGERRFTNSEPDPVVEPTETVQEVEVPEIPAITDNEVLVNDDTQIGCSKTPYVESYGKNSANNEPAIQEYVVPVNCTQSIAFKRQDDPSQTNEWGGSFGVYLQEDGHNEYLFDHLGLLINIAGGETWEVTEEGDLWHFFLSFADMGASQQWNYYINLNSKKLVAGFDSDLGLDVLTPGKTTQIRLNTTPQYCENEEDIQVTDMILVDNEDAAVLTSPINEPCLGRLEISFPSRITVGEINLEANTVVLSVTENGDYTYNYKTFTLVK